MHNMCLFFLFCFIIWLENENKSKLKNENSFDLLKHLEVIIVLF